MPRKRSTPTLLHTFTQTLRSRLFRQTTAKQANSLETVPLDEPLAPTQTPRSKLPDRFLRLGHGLMVFWAIAAALAAGTSPSSVQYWERQAQSLMFRVRGPIATPNDIVILAIDDESLDQLSSSRWPLKRKTYGDAIAKVMQSGAKAVAINLLLDKPSSYSSGNVSTDCTLATDQQIVDADDRSLQKVLERFDGKVVLGMDFGAIDNRQGEQFRINLPYCPFRTPEAIWGSMRFPLDQNAQIHRLASEDLKAVRSLPELELLFEDSNVTSFAEATLKAAQTQYPAPVGENLFFYGYDGAFSKNTVPFWNVLSPENWNSQYLKNGQVFKDKIVLIGPTTKKAGSDVVNTPFGAMMLTELQANAIATLLHHKSIRNAFPNRTISGFAVLILVLGAGMLQAQARQPLAQLRWASAIAAVWTVIGYVLFTQGLVIVPIAVPVAGIVLIGITYLGTGLAHEYQNKRLFRNALKQYVRVPIVQELISNQADFKDLADEQKAEILRKKLGGRYQITKILGSGGFGETYIAEDTQRPGQPQCVVKHLRPTSDNPKHLQLARRLFKSEAETLQRLGEHDQIPRLLAYFDEEGEFYLVQEFIAGEALSEEVAIGRHVTEARLVQILRELLTILNFVHSCNVIHRDIKPSNVIKRSVDGKLVLIDFGAVKELHNQLTDADPATVTIGIGTQGYMPQEQCAGNPRFNSDIYALGMIGVQALTGLPLSQLREDPQTGEILWRDRAIVSSPLAAILSKMVHYDFRQRYQSAQDVLRDLDQLTNLSSLPIPADYFEMESDEEDITTTRPWPNSFSDEVLPPTEPPPEVPPIL